jgi:hypothetical protein
MQLCGVPGAIMPGRALPGAPEQEPRPRSLSAAAAGGDPPRQRGPISLEEYERRQRQAEQDADDEDDDEDAEPEPAAKANCRLPIEDFIAHSPDHSYIYRPDGAPWSAQAVNSRVAPVKQRPPRRPLAASKWLDRNDAVEQRTWAPGEPQIINNKLFDQGGVIEKEGARVFNLYRPPAIIHPTDNDVAFWQTHLRELWPDEAGHIEKWFAHRTQRPGEKINHAVLLAGEQGIGKDAVIEPLRRAIGAWNFKEISPQAVLGQFNEFVQSVVLRISEGKDLGDVDRFAFYEATKTLTAAPPDTLRCNQKHIRPFYLPNITGVIITSNHKVSGIYLPADDRRHFVAWSPKQRTDYDADYWAKYWRQLEDGGAAAVAKHLRGLDLSGFDPKAPPKQTQAFWEIVDSLRTSQQSDLDDVIEALGRERGEPDGQGPPLVTIPTIIAKAKDQDRWQFVEFLKDTGARRKIVIELEDAGYHRLNNPDDKKRGRWRRFPSGLRTNVYRRKDLTDSDGFALLRKEGVK